MRSKEVIELFAQGSTKKTLFWDKSIEYFRGKSEFLSLVINEIDLCADIFNQINLELLSEHNLFDNSFYLKNIGIAKLPKFREVLRETQEKSLLEGVFKEFFEFEFLDEIEDLEQVLVCGLVGFYRTAMLHINSNLRGKKPQFASAIEEMSAFLYLEKDRKTKIFEHTKHWILNWEGEGFSKKLFEKLNSKND